MSGESSEEKSLPPSQKKLREGRKKGQISKSTDVITAILMLFLIGYLVLGWPLIEAAFARMFDTAGLAASRRGPDSWNVAIRDTWIAMGTIMIPLYILSFMAILLGSVISNKGIVISFHPIKPDLKKIHPVEGFKKIFSLRNFVEFLKALIKSIIILVVLGIIGWFGFEALMQAPLCREDCFSEVLMVVAMPLVIAALVLFIASALVDITLQNWLFTRDMKMTHSEMKREMKEMYGDPMIRRARNQARQGGGSGGSGKATKFLKSKAPTLLICSGAQMAVSLRYVPGETPAPVVIAKATGTRAALLIAEAVDDGISVVNEPDVALALLQQGRIETFVPESLFRDVAKAMSKA